MENEEPEARPERVVTGTASCGHPYVAHFVDPENNFDERKRLYDELRCPTCSYLNCIVSGVVNGTYHEMSLKGHVEFFDRAFPGWRECVPTVLAAEPAFRDADRSKRDKYLRRMVDTAQASNPPMNVD